MVIINCLSPDIGDFICQFVVLINISIIIYWNLIYYIVSTGFTFNWVIYSSSMLASVEEFQLRVRTWLSRIYSFWEGK